MLRGSLESLFFWYLFLFLEFLLVALPYFSSPLEDSEPEIEDQIADGGKRKNKGNGKITAFLYLLPLFISFFCVFIDFLSIHNLFFVFFTNPLARSTLFASAYFAFCLIVC